MREQTEDYREIFLHVINEMNKNTNCNQHVILCIHILKFNSESKPWSVYVFGNNGAVTINRHATPTRQDDNKYSEIMTDIFTAQALIKFQSMNPIVFDIQQQGEIPEDGIFGKNFYFKLVEMSSSTQHSYLLSFDQGISKQDYRSYWKQLLDFDHSLFQEDFNEKTPWEELSENLVIFFEDGPYVMVLSFIQPTSSA